MSKTQEALKLALEALEESLGYVEDEAETAQRLYGQYPTRKARIQGLKDDARKHMDAITAIREALAEQPKVWVTPKLRPLAKLAKELDGVVADVEQGDGFDDVCLDTVKYVRDELAEQPAPAPEERKRQARSADTWVGLTDEEVTWLCDTAKSHEQTWGMFVRTIEAKLREKNAS